MQAGMKKVVFDQYLAISQNDTRYGQCK